jgi:transcriptional regulator CtsR
MKKAGPIMKNMADAIESFIVGQLLAASKNTVLVQRNELADRLSCAPSQISYVLSTRFTPERGYLVESRRGSGGFIRIVRILPVEEQEQEPSVEEILQYWHSNRMLTDREYELLHYLMGIMDVSERDKRRILREAVDRMVKAG